MAPSPTSPYWQRLSSLRAERGMTMTDLAKAASITVGYVSLIESGQRNPREPVVKRIADALDMKPEDLRRTA
jgi:transcriptional regulator with XRE-family HTH domain